MTKKVKNIRMPKRYLQGDKPLRYELLSNQEIIALAREIKGKNQADFGKEIGKSQSVVSKYEKGIADPPPEVVSHCVTIFLESEGGRPLSLDEVVSKLRQADALPIAPCLYQAVSAVIDAFSLSARLPSTKTS